MSGINPNVMVHRLNIDPTFKPIKHKCRPVDDMCNNVIDDEVNKLLKAQFIKEV